MSNGLSLALFASLLVFPGLPWMAVAYLTPAAPARSSIWCLRRTTATTTKTLNGSLHLTRPQRAGKRHRSRAQEEVQQGGPQAVDSSETAPIFVDARHTCNVCRRAFPSRNALFRHLRHQADDSDPQTCGCCQNAWPAGESSSLSDRRAVVPVPFRIAVRFGYCPLRLGASTDMEGSSSASTADAAANWVLQSLRQELDTPSTDAVVVTISSVTRASDAKLRAPCLQQEGDCAAAGDVLVVTGVARPESGSFPSPSSISQMLASRLLAVSSSPIFGDSGLQVRVESVKVLDRPFHAERSATQYIYHYLLPVSWLRDPSHELLKWVAGQGRLRGLPSPGLNASSSKTARPIALIRLKQALRRMESPRFNPLSSFLTDEGEGSDYAGDRHLGPQRRQRRSRVAAGRFGGLAFKTRQAFHNYCDQRLMGAISPNHDTVWRCVDRARIVDFIARNNTLSRCDASHCVNFVLEFRGDAFLRYQIRTMVGTAVAMANGWLPMETTVPLTTSPHYVISTLPCAPPGRLYLAATRFHFEEMSASGRSLFDTRADGFAMKSDSRSKPLDDISSGSCNVEWIRRALMSQKDDVEERRSEKDWLRTVEMYTCRATRAALEATNCEPLASDGTAPSVAADDRERIPLSPPPGVYGKVLAHLRSIVAREAWPKTSTARSSVISNVGSTQGTGSFTVVNPSVVTDANAYTLGNELFPDLVNDVFALEQALSHEERDLVKATDGKMSSSQTSNLRVASSHCAINGKAQFLPHVDSGRGAGQAISLIVGLGDYRGGELGVEGSLHDIRYKPLEFDGWKLRHWTRPFKGERFSLVWFTPAEGIASSTSYRGNE